jgi:6-phosphofructokinase 1
VSARNAIYAQSGGVTAVINASACGVIETARRHRRTIGRVYAARHGILGILSEDLIDTTHESADAIRALRHTPAAAFGSCRYDLPALPRGRAHYERLIEVLRAHDVGYLFYNGGNGSADTAYKIAHILPRMGYPLVVVGIPKTIDNDIVGTDCSPGFGSAAKYAATSMREAAADLASMARSSTKVFVLELMGRNAGWIAAACGLAAERRGDAPHVLLLPEVPFDPRRFLARVREAIGRHGCCAIAVAEGLRDRRGRLLSQSRADRVPGHEQLGGVAPLIADLVRRRLGCKVHWSVVDYLQRSARHLASAVDVEQAYAVGKAAVELALAGRSAVMPVIVRTSERPYRWTTDVARLETVMNREKTMPRSYISADGFHITAKCRRYLAPLIQGEALPPFSSGLPVHAKLRNLPVRKKLARGRIA